MRFPKAFTEIPYLIDEQTITLTANRQRRTVNLKEKIPLMTRGKVVHVVALHVETILTPTFTTAPTKFQLPNSLRALQVKGDGSRVMVDLLGPDMRAMEAFENFGRLVNPDPDLNGGTGTAFHDSRRIDLGPPNTAGAPSDFAIPSVLLKTGAIEVEAPAFTDISADTTAGTVIQRIYACCILLDSVRIPPKAELRRYTAAGTTLEIGERALYLGLLLLNNDAHAAITAGLFNSFTLSDRVGPVFASLAPEVLNRQFNALNAVGQFGIIQGEPRAATDDNLKEVNGATPTALQSPVGSYQPVVFNGPGMRLTKVEVEGPMKLTWDGSQATASALVRRILPRSEKEASELAIVAFNELNLQFRGGKVKTLSKLAFSRPDRVEYMPWDFSYTR